MDLIILENKQTVLVFKTNIQKQSQAKKLDSLFNKPEILKWNIDFEDCDKVLRIVTDKLTINEIIAVTNQQGFSCEELK